MMINYVTCSALVPIWAPPISGMLNSLSRRSTYINHCSERLSFSERKARLQFNKEEREIQNHSCARLGGGGRGWFERIKSRHEGLGFFYAFKFSADVTQGEPFLNFKNMCWYGGIWYMELFAGNSRRGAVIYYSQHPPLYALNKFMRYTKICLAPCFFFFIFGQPLQGQNI